MRRNCLTRPCEGCIVAKIEDPARMKMVGEQVAKVFRVYDHGEIRRSEHNGWLNRMIETANYDSSIDTPDPELEVETVKEAALYIAHEKCEAQRYPTIISSTKQGEFNG